MARLIFWIKMSCASFFYNSTFEGEINLPLKIAVLSGKGGTGKTTVSTNLAKVLSKNRKVLLLDADVEEPNDHLFYNLTFEKEKSVDVLIPKVNKETCILCGLCAKECQFGAINVFEKGAFVFKNLCHGCGVCSEICPVNAIDEVAKSIGKIKFGKSDFFNFGMGLMNIGEPSGVRIIRELKKYVSSEYDVTIIDAPPGTSCPVVEVLQNIDFAILVTESSPFGLHDLKLAVSLVGEIGIPFGVVINRYDSSFTELEEYLKTEDIPLLMKIEFDKNIAKWYSKGNLIVDKSKDLYKNFEVLFENITGVLK